MSQTVFYGALEATQRALAAAGGAPGRCAAAAFKVLDAAAAASPDAAGRACRAGCSHCCHHPVGVTFAEAVTLREAVLGLEPQQRRRLRRAVAAAADATAATSWRGLAGLPCPLLADDRCTLHACRPVPCRAWASSDPEACAAARTGGADVPFDRHAFVAGLGVAAALAAGEPAGHRELRSALAALLPAHPDRLAAAFLRSRTAGPEPSADETRAQPAMPRPGR